ncbi:unnamed protein product [Linum tenue]|uniref:PB1 domain-containing protein n=1 Tax=Linum tenue TaxID=586396 RepID=A0AAV0RG18_9ROSI|nr:unnamed protein product [Linum tenue]
MAPVKFLCSYGGRIVPPRHGETKLRYAGGTTRVLSVNDLDSFPDLMSKLAELCGEAAVELRCPLPNGDLETLVSIKSGEELAAVVEEYDRFSPGSKIRAILTTSKKQDTLVSPPPSVISAGGYSPFKKPAPSPSFLPPSLAVGHPVVYLHNRDSCGFGYRNYYPNYANANVVSYWNPVCDCLSWRN